MKIGIAQINCHPGELSGNVNAIVSMAQRAARAGCDLLLAPEMADTGYDMETVRRHASTWDHGPCASLRTAASDHGIAIICGLSEREGDRIYNTAAVIDATGELIGKYRKVHMFSMPPVCEDKCLVPGDALVTVRLGGFTFGLMICYDIRFPEMARALALAGADVLAVLAAWPPPRIEHWRLLNAARAVENQIYVAAANLVGSDGPLAFVGNSIILDPSGKPIASADDK